MGIDLEKLKSDAQALVLAVQKAGADACDCVVSHHQSLNVSVREGKLEDTDRAEGDSMTVRAFAGQRWASVSANSQEDINLLAERAVAMAKASPDDPFQGLAPVGGLAGTFADLDLYDDSQPDAGMLQERALICEAAGLAVKGVTKSSGASAGWGVSGFVLATSSGFAGGYARSGFSVAAQMVAGEGTSMERDYDFRSKIHEADLGSIAEVGTEAGRRAVRRVGSRRIKSCRVPVIYDRRIAGGLLSSLMGAINGAAIARKTSFLLGCMNEQVAHATITVTDDPLVLRGLGSRPFDGEGWPCLPLTLVENGTLRHWLLDWAAARELDLESNGRAGRSGAGTHPGTTNCRIEPGAETAESLIRSLERGLFLTETIGHGVNMVTGDYSKGASGFWIENGEVTYPVSEITIAGNLKDMFARMTAANDLELRFATNAPTLRVEGMTIGGS